MDSQKWTHYMEGINKNRYIRDPRWDEISLDPELTALRKPKQPKPQKMLFFDHGDGFFIYEIPKMDRTMTVDLPKLPSGGYESWTFGWVQAVTFHETSVVYRNVKKTVCIRSQVAYESLFDNKVTHINDSTELSFGWNNVNYIHNWYNFDEGKDPEPCAISMHDAPRGCWPWKLNTGEQLDTVKRTTNFDAWLVARYNTLQEYKVLAKCSWGFEFEAFMEPQQKLTLNHSYDDRLLSYKFTLHDGSVAEAYADVIPEAALHPPRANSSVGVLKGANIKPAYPAGLSPYRITPNVTQMYERPLVKYDHDCPYIA